MKKNEPFPQPDNWLEHRVAYAEVDAMSQVYYGNYYTFFERGRSKFIRDHGMSYSEVEERGLFLPVREAGCRHWAPARYDELIHVRTGISQWGRASMTFVYEVYGPGRKTLLARGFTQHACVNADGRPVPTPGWLRGLFA